MKNVKNTKKRIALITSLSILALVLIALIACLIFLLDCYEAQEQAIEAFMPDSGLSYREIDGGLAFEPQGAEVGFIFYPGAKVEHEAYIPLMEACADKGILCVLVEMPLYFPLLNPRAGEDVRELYPQIERWYIGGHSLGGYSASSYLEQSHGDYEGFVLLASYSSADLSDTQLRVLSIYGSEDTVMNRERYEQGKEKLPPTAKEIIIDGGCHAFFGMYEGQDGEYAKITNREQILQSAQAIYELINE
ncbi:MAG: alpha/beta hydrolase [Clostridia bacterium]|nr:alpha/beta hydrolase [Clostridia bacterium]